MSVKEKRVGDSASNRIMVRLDTTRLEEIEKQLGKRFVAQIGILGGKSSREAKLLGESHTQYQKRVKKILAKKQASSSTEGLSNAELGLIHEKGSPSRGIKPRSFLEMPLTTKMPALMQKIGAMLLEGLNASNIELAYKKLGAAGETIVLQAFSTRGFGRWKVNSPATIARKGSDKPLIDTGQLRASISYRVVSK